MVTDAFHGRHDVNNYYTASTPSTDRPDDRRPAADERSRSRYGWPFMNLCSPEESETGERPGQAPPGTRPKIR